MYHSLRDGREKERVGTMIKERRVGPLEAEAESNYRRHACASPPTFDMLSHRYQLSRTLL